MLDDGREGSRRNRQVISRALGVAKFVAQSLVGRRLGIVASDVTHQARELLPCGWIDAAMGFKALPRACFERGQVGGGPSHPNDWHVEVAALGHRLQRREDLFKGQVPGCTEEYQSV